MMGGLNDRGLQLVPDETHRIPLIAVVSGGVQATPSSRENAAALVGCLEHAGCNCVVVEWGPRIADRLGEHPFDFAVSAVRDPHLLGGSVEQVCAAIGLRCLGPSPDVLRLCADKSITSGLLRRAGVPVPEQTCLGRFDALAGVVPASLTFIDGPMYVKPRHGLRGDGVKRIGHGALAAAAIANTFNYEDEIVVEREVPGDEFTVVLIGGADGPFAVGVARQEYASDDPNRASWGRSYTADHDLPAQTRRAIVEVGRSAMFALGLDGLASVDVIVDKTLTAWVIDVDGSVDWRDGSALSACLKSSEVTVADLLRGMIRDASAGSRLAA